jgi:hypothetical protein
MLLARSGEESTVSRDWRASGPGRDRQPGRRPYLVLMAVAVTLFLLAGLVVSRFSSTWAVVLGGIALVIPPIAVIVANAGRERRD